MTKPFRFISYVLTVAVTLLIVSPSTALSQDFNQLLKAVDKVAADLTEMTQKESATRNQQDEKLKTSIAGLSGNNQAIEGGLQATQLAEIISELASLKEELWNLKRSMNNNSVQFASFKPVSSSSSNETEIQLEEMSQKLDNLENILSTYGASASSNPISGLRISGFFDVNSMHKPSAEDNTQFDLGQVEIDMDHDVSERTYVRITPVWNNGSGVLSLGPAYTRIQLMDYQNTSITELSISAGKMDIPFGIGLHENASANRKIPTRPKAVSHTHGGWGDYGLEFDMKFPFGNFTLYAVNGFASSTEVDSVLSLALGVAEGTVINTTPSYAFGTRIGMTPFSSFEYGMSFAIGQNVSGENEMRLIGADVQYSISSFSFRGEFIYHSLNRSIDPTTNRAYYFESRYSSGKWTVASRYGSFRPDGENWDGRFAIATGYEVTHNVEFKFESLFNEKTSENTDTFQLIARF